MWPPPPGHVPLPPPPPPPVEYTVDAPPGAEDDELDRLPWESNPYEKLTIKQARFLAELMTVDTIEQACEQAGVAPRTARRWMAQKDFGAAMRQAVIDRAAH